MRLIDADKVIYSDINCTDGNTYMVVHAPMIDKQKTAYDIDEVVKQLEEEREHSHADFEQYAELHGIDTKEDWFYAGLKRAIEIVKRGEIDEI